MPHFQTRHVRSVFTVRLKNRLLPMRRLIDGVWRCGALHYFEVHAFMDVTPNL
jgi:hypothetical protein